MKDFITKMWRLNRTIVSRGYDSALEEIQKELELKILSYESGREFWGWKVPKKWALEEAYLIDLNTGEKILDTAESVLHVVAGSLPIEMEVDKSKLLRHLHYDKKRPEYIPCIYKYYDQPEWGLCCNKKQYERIMRGERFKVVIKTRHTDGNMKIGEYTIKGKSPYTIYILAHLDGPAQANNNLSGVAISIALAKELSKRKTQYTYKFLYLPGTIGPIAYLASNPEASDHALGAVILEMLGTDTGLTVQYSRQGEQYIDRVASYVLSKEKNPAGVKDFAKIVYAGERVFDAPGIDIPTIAFSRTDIKQPNLPFYEYRTSGDVPEKVSEEKLYESLEIIKKMVHVLENDFIPIRNYKGIPFLSSYNMWVEWNDNPEKRALTNSIMFSIDNNLSVFDIASNLKIDFDEILEFINNMTKVGLVKKQSIF